MQKSLWFPLLLVLESFALLVGGVTYIALLREDHRHVWIMTIGLCVAAWLVATLVSKVKTWVTHGVLIALGIAFVGLGLFAIRILAYHERAGLALGLGIITMLGGLAGILWRRSLSAAFSGLVVMGGIALAIGLYFLKYHDPDYRRPLILELVIASFCILAGIVGVAIARHRERMAVVSATPMNSGSSTVMSAVQQAESDDRAPASKATRQ
jgi:hypothetical protein